MVSWYSTICKPNRKGLHAWQAAFSGKGNKALDNGVASTSGAFDNIHMNGQEVFKFAVRAVPTVRIPQQCRPWVAVEVHKVNSRAWHRMYTW